MLVSRCAEHAGNSQATARLAPSAGWWRRRQRRALPRGPKHAFWEQRRGMLRDTATTVAECPAAAPSGASGPSPDSLVNCDPSCDQTLIGNGQPLPRSARSLTCTLARVLRLPVQQHGLPAGRRRLCGRVCSWLPHQLAGRRCGVRGGAVGCSSRGTQDTATMRAMRRSAISTGVIAASTARRAARAA